VGSFAAVRAYIDSLIHPSAQQDALTSSRHRAFIAPRLLGSLVALAAFPIYISLRGVPSLLEVGVFAWLIAPILIAYFLSRTGRYESAHVLSSLALTGLVTTVAVETGGINSFAAIWLVIVPLEAALSASRRVVGRFRSRLVNRSTRRPTSSAVPLPTISMVCRRIRQPRVTTVFGRRSRRGSSAATT